MLELSRAWIEDKLTPLMEKVLNGKGTLSELIVNIVREQLPNIITNSRIEAVLAGYLEKTIYLAMKSIRDDIAKIDVKKEVRKMIIEKAKELESLKSLS